MKRGLKAVKRYADFSVCEPMIGYNRFPDEKGTEREKVDYPWKGSYNRFPDEKGTESARVGQQLFRTLLQPFPR